MKYTLDCNGTIGDGVTVVQNKDVLTLCEVQVYGKMVDGKMGTLFILGILFGTWINLGMQQLTIFMYLNF